MNDHHAGRRRRRVLLAVLVAAVAPVAMPQSAAAQEAPAFTVTFTELVPEVSQTQSASIAITESGWFQGLTWVERTGIMAEARMTVRICDPGGACVDAADPAASPRFVAGTLTVSVTATLPPGATPDGTGNAVGRLAFGNDDALPAPPSTTIPSGGGGSGGLSPTGSEPLSMVLWAIAAVAVGATLIAFTRQRRVHGAPR